MLNDSPVVELVVNDNEDECKDDANNTDDNHRNVDCQCNSLDI